MTVNTPENRFIKYILSHSVLRLSQFEASAEKHYQSPDNARLSDSFLHELAAWRGELSQWLHQPVFDAVGEYSDLGQTSLILQQQAGYAAAYRIWQALKVYLECFGSQAHVSVKTVADLYEVWCFLKIKSVLESIGFKENQHAQARALRIAGFDKQLTDGMGAAFHLSRDDGIRIRLAHEPLFKKPQPKPLENHIYSWISPQKPDIVLEASFASTGETMRWVFDAKYRLDNKNEGMQLAPEDAINQMHRYRDALIHMDKALLVGEPLRKTRPMMGAFVLYPAVYDEVNEINPYHNAIDEVGIGAFPALPGMDNRWLSNFLKAQFSNSYAVQMPETYFLESPLRIAPTGAFIERYSDLTMVASLGDNAPRGATYFDAFKNGSAKWYHLPLGTSDKREMEADLIKKVRYCALAVKHTDSSARSIRFVYPVNSIAIVSRHKITQVQAGLVSNSTEDYWLFELGASIPIANPIEVIPDDGHFKLTLTKLLALKSGATWDKLAAWFKFF